ncbi:hypothetical protein GCM10012320_27410 [Sinomonas cellulolyticus]|uniref:Uncharacterized protein n=1 Tax=Sinomonas cellulolyticus TaxID=2801916 RepID=A0ABS1K3F9_9MICC|nr:MULTISPECIES: hypothetical protein [Sinomonas]MBL0706201.1 hypothetical protein [Sinomonas cellulolyticus]GHG55507.1 hypothetical protein GCM10012320_27410 [Sinomonas sp. KCTC 49339]
MKLNQKAYENAKKLIRDGKVERDSRDDWSEHAPSAKELSEYLDAHGEGEYSRWFLGVDEDESGTKSRYKFPFSDLRKVHRCAVISGESRASQYDHDEIREALGDLLKRIDEE